MRLASVFLLFALLSVACGNDPAPNAGPEELQQRAKPAERNLVRIRDAVVAFYAARGTEPISLDELTDYGSGPRNLEPSEDYSDLGYSFYALKFSDEGELEQAWLMATPKGGSDALQVRMNGVTGTFEYLPAGERWGPAAEDTTAE